MTKSKMYKIIRR